MALVTNTPELTGYATRGLYRAMFDPRHQRGLLLCGVWCLGEYGDAVVSGAALQPGEPPLAATAEEVVRLLEALLRDLPATGSAPLREMTLTALVKLTTRLPEVASRIHTLLQAHQVRALATDM